MDIKKIETLAEFKREMKTFVRGVIKSKIYNSEDGKLNFIVQKNYDKEQKKYFTIMFANSEYFNTEFLVEISTRVFNKITPELYTKTIEQFNKLKNFAGMTVTLDEQAE
jgi:hypothetical protein